MQQFFSNLVDLLTTSPVIYLAGVLYTASAFSWMRSLVDEYKARSEWFYICVILINGMIPTILNVNSLQNLGNLNPAFIMILVPIAVVLEFSLISRDKPRTYIFLACMIMLQLACIFGLSAAFVTAMSAPGSDLFHSDIHTAVLCLTMMLLSLSLVQFAFYTKKYQQLLKVILHDSSSGSLLFVYMLLNGIVLGVATGFDYLVYFTDAAVNPLRTPTLVGMLVRYILIMVTSIVIIYVQCRVEANKQTADLLSGHLALEKKRRQSGISGKIISYGVNITQERVIEGRDAFTDTFWENTQGDYQRIFTYIVDTIVRPDDRERLMQERPHVTPESFLEGASTFSVKFRYNTREIFDYLKPEPSTAQQIQRYELDWAWAEASISYLLDDNTQDIIAYVDINDITDRENERANLEKAASTDALTGLYNRASMERSIRARLAQKDPDNPACQCALFMLDLDHFKEVNDTLGHPAGDALLKDAAATIKGTFRDVDIVGRLGGDEFCVLMDGGGTEETIRNKAELLNQRLRFQFDLDNGQVLRTSSSIGIARFPLHGSDYESLYHSADKALYRSKERGRDCYELS